MAFFANSYEKRPSLTLEAARLRALHTLKMPDAIHAATAKMARCTHFLTADALLAQAIGARRELGSVENPW